MYSPSRAEIGESGFSRYDVPVPPSSASSLSGGRREAGRQAFQQGGGCLGFPQGFPGNVAQGNQGGAHGVMTGEGIQRRGRKRVCWLCWWPSWSAKLSC